MEWKTIPGFSSYEASEYGDVRRAVDGTKCNGAIVPAGLILKPAIKSNGYAQFALVNDDGKKRYINAHRIVALTFIGPCPGRGYVVAHNDGSRRNNHKDNLRWATNSENQLDRILHGTHCCGGRHALAKLTNSQAKEIRKLWNDGEMISTLSRIYSVSRSVVGRIVNNHSYIVEQKVAEYAVN